MYCQCGCGQTTTIADGTDASKGWVKGQPIRFVKCHQRRIYSKYGTNTDCAEYKAWWTMKHRCESDNDENYFRYGARGIKVIGKLNEFSGFMEVMGERPSPNHSIDRLNNSGNYEEGNVRWATRSQQARNMRRPKLTIDDAREIRKLATRMSVSDMSEDFSVSKRHIQHILKGKYWDEHDRGAG